MVKYSSLVLGKLTLAIPLLLSAIKVITANKITHFVAELPILQYIINQACLMFKAKSFES